MKLVRPLLVVLAFPAAALAQTKTEALPGKLASPVPVEKLPAVTKDALLKVMKEPTLTVLSPVEEFTSHMDVYQWLLDRPDRTAVAWRRLGVESMEIKPTRDGGFSWKDDQGTEIVWKCVAKSDSGRIWFAEGKVNPGALLPTIPVQGVAVLRHVEKADPKTAETKIKHQVEVHLQTDSKAAALATRVLGDQAPKMAREGTESLLAFFSGPARYAHAKPEKADALFAEDKVKRKN